MDLDGLGWCLVWDISLFFSQNLKRRKLYVYWAQWTTFRWLWGQLCVWRWSCIELRVILFKDRNRYFRLFDNCLVQRLWHWPPQAASLLPWETWKWAATAPIDFEQLIKKQFLSSADPVITHKGAAAPKMQHRGTWLWSLTAFLHGVILLSHVHVNFRGQLSFHAGPSVLRNRHDAEQVWGDKAMVRIWKHFTQKL